MNIISFWCRISSALPSKFDFNYNILFLDLTDLYTIICYYTVIIEREKIVHLRQDWSATAGRCLFLLALKIVSSSDNLL